MPHGAPDWSKYRTSSVTFPVLDLAELAARLYSPNVFDRRGDVIFMDDFENGLNKWDPIRAGGTSAVNLYYTPTKIGGYSIKLYCDAVAGAYAGIRNYTAYPAAHRLGLECSVSIHRFIDHLWISLGVYTGAQFVRGELSYYPTTNTLSYLNDAGGQTNLTTDLDLNTWTGLFHVFKIVIDTQAIEYMRIIVDDVQYTMTGIAAHAANNLTRPFLWSQIVSYGDGANDSDTFVDPVIITQDEP